MSGTFKTSDLHFYGRRGTFSISAKTFSKSWSIFTFFAQALFQDQGLIFYLFANLLKIEDPFHFLTRVFNFYAHGFFKKDQEKAQDQDLATF